MLTCAGCCLFQVSIASKDISRLDAAAAGVQVRNVKPASIGLDDSFFRLGSDSNVAMRLVGEARGMGMQRSVVDLFRDPQLP